MTHCRNEYAHLAGTIGCLALVAAIGCGESGPERFRVQGNVVHLKKPVSSGMVIFEPVASAGEQAPTVYLPISDGKYDSFGEGPGKGSYRVTISGFDREGERKDSDGILITPSLFPDIHLEVDVPLPDGKLDIETAEYLAK